MRYAVDVTSPLVVGRVTFTSPVAFVSVEVELPTLSSAGVGSGVGSGVGAAVGSGVGDGVGVPSEVMVFFLDHLAL